MTILQHLAIWYLERRKRSESRSTSGDPYQILYDHFGGGQTASGEKVDSSTAMTLSAVFQAVRLISETIASLPIKMFRKREDGSRERVEDHAITELLNFNPNEEMTGFDLKQAMGQDGLLHGNGYAEIIRNGRGEAEKLWYMDARRTFPKRERARGPLIYVNRTLAGKERKLPLDRVLHLKGLGNGLAGLSVIAKARENLGLSLGAEKTGSAFFGNGMRLSGSVETDNQLTDKAVKHLKDSLREMHQGSANTGSVAILEEGLHWKPMSIPPSDAQFIETRKMGVIDVARWFNIPPHMLYDLERATFSNIEHQQIQFVQYTLMPWIVKWETILRWKLETEAEAKVLKIFPQFEVRALLRGDVKSRFTAHKLSVDAGWQTREEVRRLEELDPLPGLEKPLKAMNLDTIDADGNTEPKPTASNAAPPAIAAPADDDDEGDDTDTTSDDERSAAVVRSHTPSLTHIAGKLLRREAKAARTAAKKPNGFLQWADRYFEKLEPQIIDELQPTFEALAGSLLAVGGRCSTDEILTQVAGAAEVCATEHVDDARGALLEAAASSIPAGMQAALDDVISRSETTPACSALVDKWIIAIEEAIGVKEVDYATEA